MSTGTIVKPASASYMVTVDSVKEVSLYGRAALDYWGDYLAPEGLAPFDSGGCAEVVLIAAEMVWLGVRFSELSVSVAVAQPGAPKQRGGMYLIQAFNSIRPFAWVERTFFQTPYDHARTRVSVQAPVGFTLGHGPADYLSAAQGQAASLAAHGPHTTAGPIYLPAALTRTARAEKLFFAELSGETDVYPFAPGGEVRLAPSPRAPVVGWLQASSFAGHEWHVRAAATHKKSQTYRAADPRLSPTTSTTR
jgi:hypothetical protein